MKKEQIPHQVYEIQSVCRNPHIHYGFLKGAGGTGKTYAIAAFITNAKVHHHQYLFVGPTGKSVSVAEEKGLVGSTIHRFFMIQTNDTNEKINDFIGKKFGSTKKYYAEMRKKFLEIKYVFIDEISMVNDQLLFHILKTIEHAGRQGTQIFLAGDYHQLPSVVTDDSGATTSRPIIETLIAERDMKVIEFNTRYRSDNEDYNEFLFDIRAGKIHDSQSIANYLRHHFNVHKNGVAEDITPNLTFLEFMNEKVREINEDLLDELPGVPVTSEHKIIKDEYTTNDTWIRNKIIDDFQMDKTLVFKVGAKVLFRVNNMDGQFKNGDEGIIESIKVDSIMVRKLSQGNPLLEIKKHTYKTGILEEEDGFFIEVEQYPFSLGNARTIHKSQGDGFENLHLDFSFFSFPKLYGEYKWQLFYVCLSRVIDPSKVWISEASLKLVEQQWDLFKKVNHYGLSLNFDNDDMAAETYLRRI